VRERSPLVGGRERAIEAPRCERCEERESPRGKRRGEINGAQ
jgi:hypothetical protein